LAGWWRWVSISWEGGFGVQLVITNNNNYSIYNVSLDSISISGFVIGGLANNEGKTIAEMPPGCLRERAFPSEV